MLNCANEVFEKGEFEVEVYSKGDILKYWIFHYWRKDILKNEITEEVSGISLFQQQCINRITKGKKK